MLKNLNKRKKKKGFTLIELVIVLAVLAIIALIAIPNFTKVRNDSLTKADTRTAEQLKKITLMGIANGDIIPKANIAMKVIDGKTEVVAFAPGVLSFEAIKGAANYKEMIKEVSKPQVNGEDFYVVKVDENGKVTVYKEDGIATLCE